MGPTPNTVDHGDRVIVDIPPGVTYAALALRVEAEHDDAVKTIVMGLADQFAAVVDEFQQVLTPERRVTIVAGAESVAAFDIASRQTASALGLTREGSEVVEVDPTLMADALRYRSATRNGIAHESLLRWDQLQPSEQRRWEDTARDAIDYMDGI